MERAVRLYTFKKFCDDSALKKEVLDCGAGVHDSLVEPPFVRFYTDGYVVHGIDNI